MTVQRSTAAAKLVGEPTAAARHAVDCPEPGGPHAHAHAFMAVEAHPTDGERARVHDGEVGGTGARCEAGGGVERRQAGDGREERDGDPHVRQRNRDPVEARATLPVSEPDGAVAGPGPDLARRRRGRARSAGGAGAAHPRTRASGAAGQRPRSGQRQGHRPRVHVLVVRAVRVRRTASAAASTSGSRKRHPASGGIPAGAGARNWLAGPATGSPRIPSRSSSRRTGRMQTASRPAGLNAAHWKNWSACPVRAPGDGSSRTSALVPREGRTAVGRRADDDVVVAGARRLDAVVEGQAGPR